MWRTFSKSDWEWRRFDEDDSRGVLRKTIPKGPRTQIVGF